MIISVIITSPIDEHNANRVASVGTNTNIDESS